MASTRVFKKDLIDGKWYMCILDGEETALFYKDERWHFSAYHPDTKQDLNPSSILKPMFRV